MITFILYYRNMKCFVYIEFRVTLLWTSFPDYINFIIKLYSCKSMSCYCRHALLKCPFESIQILFLNFSFIYKIFYWYGRDICFCFYLKLQFLFLSYQIIIAIDTMSIKTLDKSDVKHILYPQVLVYFFLLDISNYR